MSRQSILKENLADIRNVTVSEESQSVERVKVLNRQLRKKVYKLQNLLEVSFELNSVLDRNKIIHSFLLNIFGLLTTNSVTLLLGKSLYSKNFTAQYHQGLKSDQAKQLAIRKSDPLVKSLRADNRIIRADGEEEFEYLSIVKSVGGNLIAPIVHHRHVLGLVVVGDKHGNRRYTNEETEHFNILSNFLGAALSNAQLYNEMKRVSLTDPLTGLFNRRYFEDFLDTEVERARRFNHPLSLVILDVDFFKNYNDKLGHTNGDTLLKKLAGVLNKTVRRTDIIARYGGEEFCVILPEIAEHGAHCFSERLKDVIFSHPFDNREIQPNGHISVSLGTATFPWDAQATAELVERADKALYSAKRKGRNRVEIYGRLKS